MRIKNKDKKSNSCIYARIGVKGIWQPQSAKEVLVLLESTVERHLREETKKRKGMALKFISPGMNGVPDRIVLMPDGKMAFVELKAPGKKPRPIQMKRKRMLERLGFPVYVVDNIEQIGGILDEIQST